MLSARYLAGCTDDIVKIYAQLEHDIVTDMARRLAKMGEVTEASEWQAKIFKEIGGLQGDIYKYLKKYNAQAQKRISELFTEALEKSTASDAAVIDAAIRKMSDTQAQILEATLKKVQNAAIVTGSKKVKEEAKNGAIKVFSGLSRLTMSIAETGSNEFISEANAAYMKVASGAFDYNTALKQAVTNLANKGVYTIEYTDSGKRRLHTMEGAVRSNIMTGINQTAQQVTQDNCAELGCDLVEVSTHMGARPSHAAWQGKIYSLSGASDKYPSFYEVCRPGEPDGICGINCRHSYYPYFEGTEPQYTAGELDEMREPKVKYNGKEITQYEAEQQLRACERNVRGYKRQASALEAANLDATGAKLKIKEWQSAARDIVSQTGVPRDYNREFIGTTKARQPTGTIKNKTGIKILYESKSTGGSVTTSYSEKLNEEKQNLEAIRPLAKRGWAVTLNAPTNLKGEKTADATIKGVSWEIKTNYSPTKSAIDTALRAGKNQSNNIVLHVQSEISDTDLYSAIKNRVLRSTIEKIIIVKKNKTFMYSRKEILEWFEKK